jgi:hypothetical protein
MDLMGRAVESGIRGDSGDKIFQSVKGYVELYCQSGGVRNEMIEIQHNLNA